jgi:hypothetical protein
MTTGWLLLKVLKEKLSNLKENLKRFDMEKETLEEAAEMYVWGGIYLNEQEKQQIEIAFIAGAKWMQEQMKKLKDFDTWKEWKNS